MRRPALVTALHQAQLIAATELPRISWRYVPRESLNAQASAWLSAPHSVRRISRTSVPTTPHTALRLKLILPLGGRVSAQMLRGSLSSSRSRNGSMVMIVLVGPTRSLRVQPRFRVLFAQHFSTATVLKSTCVARITLFSSTWLRSKAWFCLA